ncbi:MAG: NADPH-dependent assimilatory sulfite reductase hemoprotein subunit, partial [Pirellulales bacterium]
MSEEQALDGVEKIKLESHYLCAPIPQDLADGNDFFGPESIQLLKYHGSYQQDDRDVRVERRKQKLDKLYTMMVRTKIPGGKMSSEQFLAELDLCDQLGNSTLRITTRQGLQLHGIPKRSIQETIRRINQAGLSTLGACGDVNRNVMSTPAPYQSAVHQQMLATAEQLATYFAPRSSSYRDIWLTDPETGEKEQVGQQHDMDTSLAGDEIEPIYGKRYLPRKFKMGVATSDDNCVDLYSQDIGWMAIVEDGELIGYNVLVGGGFGVTPSAAKTFVAVAKMLCFVPPQQVQPLAEAIITLQRDHGNREDRKVARLKYVVAEWGVEKFKQTLEQQYYGQPLEAPRPIDVTGYDDHMGWREQGDGRWFYGLNVENGRILDNERMQLKSALRKICTTLRPPIYLTPHQSMLFGDIEPDGKTSLEAILRKHGVPLTEDFSTVRRWSMACPALPLCGLAVTESERVLPSIMDALEAKLIELGLQDEVFTVRMTGCPNGCARPYNSDVGLVGRTLDKYTIFLGGRVLGDRLNFEYKDKVPTAEVV